MRWISGFGCILEDHVEKSHQEGEKLNMTRQLPGYRQQRRALQASLIARRQQMIQRSLLLRKKRLKVNRACESPPVLVWLQEIKRGEEAVQRHSTLRKSRCRADATIR
jgi:hypothetical protein